MFDKINVVGDTMELSVIKGLGPSKIKLLNKLGIDSVESLIEFFPFRYELIKRSDINSLGQDEKIIIDGIIELTPSVFYINKKLNKLSFSINTGKEVLKVVLFNRAFLKPHLKIGESVTVVGKYDRKHQTIVVTDLYFGPLEKERIETVYHTTAGITNKQLQTYMKEAIKKTKSNDLVPESLLKQYQFLSREESIHELHFPNSVDSLKKARSRMKYEELFFFMLKMNYLKNNKVNKLGLSREVDLKIVEEFIDTIPFELTSDQRKAVDEIYEDLISPRRMNRLLQGDVGSGKTIVGIIAMFINTKSNYQSALLAPTEILANQHYETAKKFLEPFGIRVGLLTGKLKTKEKKEIYNSLENGLIDVIIGTHALFTDEVEYQNLGLVITDEQHRFGVNQRSSLKNKGLTPDILYMSATPIPRTYALTLYGDMDITSIKTVPRGRKEIITLIKKEKEMKDVLAMMLSELKEQHQVYVIAPLIEESDKSDFENVYELEEKMNRAFGKFYNLGILHGKMTKEEKDQVMIDFKENKIQILISTTVVEVGVDVANATMMVIFDAYRFGLSALHQLRGRVGRSDLQSYCVLISNHETERLTILTKTNDGFKVSEEDFLIRGSGDLFGMKQSGDMVFKVADLKKDFSILLKAKEDSQNFLEGKISVNECQRLDVMKQLENSMDLD